jgi:hypothetical protein
MNYLGRCNQCDFALFATPEDVRKGETFRDVKSGLACRVGNNGVFGRCTNNHKFFPMRTVQGTYSAVHKCDSRCLNARGHSCTCSCGGANHGRGHASTIVEATTTAPSYYIAGSAAALEHVRQIESSPRRSAVHPDTYAAGMHLGEIGRFIQGTATVTQVAEGSRPYAFMTDAGNIIVWWIPDFITNPGWTTGVKITFRAKVKAHTVYNDVAQTVVTHLEEVES